MGKSTKIGTQHTADVIRWLGPRGFPHAELRNLAGAFDRGDIVGTPGVCWECKGGRQAETAGDALVSGWLAETEVERINARADVGVLVLKRASYGAARYGKCWAVVNLATAARLLGARQGDVPLGQLGQPVWMHLDTAIALLRQAGYGAPLDADDPANLLDVDRRADGEASS